MNRRSPSVAGEFAILFFILAAICATGALYGFVVSR